jgi:hypothetical protein
MNISQLPHKNLYISGALALLIIGVGIIINLPERSRTSGIASDTSSANLAASGTEEDEQDTDGDGLFDWEEFLYGSDPRKQDTDSDSTQDGEEVRAARNPAVPNTAHTGESPNDPLTQLQDPNFASTSAAISETKKEFFRKYLEQAGDEIRETTYLDLISKFDSSKLKPKREITDLAIMSENTNDALKVYLNEFGSAVLRFKSPNAPRSEIAIIEDFGKNQDPRILRELQLPAIDYANFALELRKVKVPSGLANTHLLIVEGYEGMALGLSGMITMASDPFMGAGGYQGYMIYRVQVTDAFAVLVTEVTKRGITFTKDDPGYMFYANVFAEQ